MLLINVVYSILGLHDYFDLNIFLSHFDFSIGLLIYKHLTPD